MSNHIHNMQSQIDHLVASYNGVRQHLRLDTYVPEAFAVQQFTDPMIAAQASMGAGAQLGGQEQHQDQGYRDGGRVNYGQADPQFIVEEGLANALAIHNHEQAQNDQIDPAIVHSHKDPIWNMTKNECSRLLTVYREQIHNMFPIIDIAQIQAHSVLLLTFTESAVRNGYMSRNTPGNDAIFDQDADMLRLVLALAMISEANGETDLAKRFFESVPRPAEDRPSNVVDLKPLRLLTLIVGLLSNF
ncbi:hypothetical protein MRB53_039552 [Persea americana]|nr:hypothetical protein MRB53_039552 [Persea americana]